jgi:hypothetical protein
MRRILVGTLLAAAVAMLIPSSASAQDAIVFRYKGKTGDVRFYESSNLVELQQSVNGQDLSTKIGSRVVVKREQQESSETGRLQFRDTTNRLRVDMKLPQIGEFKFDSKSTENETGSLIGDALTPLYEALSGAVVDVTFSPRGEVLKVAGLKEVVEGILKSNPIAAQFAAGASSDEGAKLSYREQFLEFPEKALAPGDEWETDAAVNLPQVGKISGKTRCKYVGVDSGSGLHRFTMTSDVKVEVDQKVGPTEVVGTVEVTGSKGEVLFDSAKGIVVKRESETKMSGDLVVSVAGMTIPIKQTQTMTQSSNLIDAPPRD